MSVTSLTSRREIPGTDITLAPLTLGCMLFGTRTTVEESGVILDAYLAAGGNSLDTANIYGAGTSEEVLGALIRTRNCRDAVVVTTKYHFGVGRDSERPGYRGNHHANVIRSCEDSLRRMGLDHIDIFLAHRPDPATPIEETLEALATLVRAGKVRCVGSSNFTPQQIESARAAALDSDLPRFVCEQAPLNLLDRQAQSDVLPYCSEAGVAFTAWSPLGGGLLTGKYTATPGETKGRYDLNLDHPRQSRRTESVLEAASAVVGIAEHLECSASQLAIGWAVSRPGVTSVLVGPRTREQLADNLGALEVEVCDSTSRALDDICAPGACVTSFRL